MKHYDRVALTRIISDLHDKLIDVEFRLARLEAICSDDAERTGRGAMAEMLTRHFSLGELNQMAFDLAVNGDEIPGTTRGEKARELIAYCERRGLLGEMISLCRERRPNASWPFV